MDTFRKKLKARIAIGAGIMLVCVLLLSLNLLLLNRFLDENIGVTDSMLFAHGVNFGLICLLILGVVFHTFKYFAALRDGEKLKKLYIAETDERTLFIMQKSGSIGMTASIIGLAIGASVSAYFNTTVFFALFGACVFVSLMKGVLKFHFHGKF
jgi:hypothetical protein